jgi:acyl carrier protein
MLDAALELDLPVLVPTGIDRAALRSQAKATADAVPPVLSGLVRLPARRPDAVPGARLALLATAGPQERLRLLRELVHGQVAAVLGHGSPGTIESDKTFKELGFDSLTAVELRNRLGAAAGRRLPATVVFDHPTVNRLVSYLDTALSAAEPVTAGTTLLAQLDRLAAAAHTLPPADSHRFAERLRRTLRELAGPDPGSDHNLATGHKLATGHDLANASDDDLFAALDEELSAR